MGRGTGGDPGAGTGRQRRRWAFVLFALPVAAVVAPAVYNRVHPELAGVPFFVWYQFTAVLFGALVTGIVYVLRGTEEHVTHSTARATTDGLPTDPPTPV